MTITKEDIQKCIIARVSGELISLDNFNWCYITYVLTLGNSEDYFIKISDDYIKYLKQKYHLIAGVPSITIITGHRADIDCGRHFTIRCDDRSKIKTGRFCSIDARPNADITVDNFCSITTKNCSLIRSSVDRNTVTINGECIKLNRDDTIQLFPTDSTLSIAPKFDGYLLNGKHNGKDYVIERNDDYRMELKEIVGI